MPLPDASNAAPPPSFPVDTLDRLAGLILKGDVVFFVGAGFSLESEWNTGSRFIKRLLIRLEALGRHLGEGGNAIRSRLRSTFEMASAVTATRRSPQPCAPETAFPYSDLEIQELARRYYETNDWFCTAFSELLSLAAARPLGEEADFLARVRTTEESLRTQPGPAGAKKLDDTALDTDSLERLIRMAREAGQKSPPDIAACRAAGKALFLDTMGFLNPEIMGGQPGAESLEKLAGSYGRRVLPRHHVIARFARDGLCGTTLTTNFDLLLEGAFRLAGFRDEQVESIDVFPPTDVSRYARVTSPREFFREGKAHRTAVLVKMHGCADTYRRVAKAAGGEGGDARRLESYLRSMVFTYREIQNWREDAWAADFLRTLLRTRTVVFTGYSLQDPVVHDTFRTVYEEMARVSRSDAGDDATDAENGTESKPPTARRRPAPTAGDAPAFFFDVLDAAMPDKSPFHALEVLKAASDAVGVPRGDFGQHPNLLRFHGRGTGKFPNLDELYRWLFHLVVRRRQRECLLNDLRRTFTALHGENRPAAEFDGVKALMNAVFDAERAEARAWATPAADAATHAERRRRMGRIVSWTESFHPGLLREFGIVDQIRREGGFQLRPAEIRRRGWYYPVMQNADWTCWGAVVELAIRRMVDHVNGDEARLPAIDRLWSAEGDHPTILFFSGNREPRPTTTSFEDAPFPPLRAVSVLFSSSDAPAQSLSLHGQPSTVCLWQLTGNDAPWRGTSWRVYPAPESGRRIRVIDEPGDEPAERLSSALQACRPPPAITLWRWASRTETEDDRRRAADWLGLPRPTL